MADLDDLNSTQREVVAALEPYGYRFHVAYWHNSQPVAVLQLHHHVITITVDGLVDNQPLSQFLEAL